MLTKIKKYRLKNISRNGSICCDGFTLIEVLVTIVVIGIAATSIMGVFISTVKTSADPMLQQQALAIAEAYMEEIQSKNFCENSPPPMQASPPQSIPLCPAETGGSELGENRLTYNDIQDYNDPAVDGGVKDQNNVTIAGLADYTVTVSVAAAALGGVTEVSGNAMRIDVTVNHAAIDPISLSSFRASY